MWRSRLRDLFSRTAPDVLPTEELKALLYEADLSRFMVEELMRRVEGLRKKDRETVLNALVEEVERIGGSVKAEGTPLPTPACVLLVGVNGSGKTTVAAKLGHRFKREGKRVVLAAADTFRAGAIEQLKIWGDRIGADVVAQKPGADPGAVVFDAWNKAIAENAVMIADTAGRLHNNRPLVDEITKIVRVLQKDAKGAPHESYLVLDGTMGQNTVSQAREFTKAVPVTGLIVTKLDGSSRGGGALAGAVELKLPIRYVGMGEKLDDLHPFDPQSFARELIGI